MRFTAHFDTLWRYPFKTEFGTIDDCYALNVMGETAWACYYSDFPVVRIDEDRILGWRNDVRGARALIVDGDTVALVGGYRDDHDRVIVGRLGDADFVPQDNLRMMLPGDAPLTSASMFAGRGPELSVVAGQVWYKIEMTDLPT